MNWYKLNEDKTVTKLPDGQYPNLTNEDKRVGYEIVGEAQVSTVFLGLDHRFSENGLPVLFETMIFGGPHDQFQHRWLTWHEATMFHDIIVKALKEGKTPEEAINNAYDNRN